MIRCNVFMLRADFDVYDRAERRKILSQDLGWVRERETVVL